MNFSPVARTQRGPLSLLSFPPAAIKMGNDLIYTDRDLGQPGCGEVRGREGGTMRRGRRKGRQ